MTVTVNAATGPFGVSAPNTAVSWPAQSTQTVTWTVNGTDAAPINVTNVNILLSLDGGNTWPITLAANTANDGTESVTMPATPSTTARVKVNQLVIFSLIFPMLISPLLAAASGFTFNSTD